MKPIRAHPNRPFLQKMIVLAMASLVVALLAACGASAPERSVVGSQNRSRPAPPLQPASFGNTTNRSTIPQRLVIESIDLDTPVEELGWSAQIDPSGRVFSNWDVTAYSAGWHVNSATPGRGGNVVLSGHNNIQGAVFRELDRLNEGDVATIWSAGRQFDYKIDRVVIVPERDATAEQRLENAGWIGDFDDDRLTLVTCWPRDGNSHRIIAVGYRVDDASRTAAIATVLD